MRARTIWIPTLIAMAGVLSARTVVAQDAAKPAATKSATTTAATTTAPAAAPAKPQMTMKEVKQLLGIVGFSGQGPGGREAGLG